MRAENLLTSFQRERKKLGIPFLGEHPAYLHARVQIKNRLHGEFCHRLDAPVSYCRELPERMDIRSHEDRVTAFQALMRDLRRIYPKQDTEIGLRCSFHAALKGNGRSKVSSIDRIWYPFEINVVEMTSLIRIHDREFDMQIK